MHSKLGIFDICSYLDPILLFSGNYSLMVQSSPLLEFAFMEATKKVKKKPSVFLFVFRMFVLFAPFSCSQNEKTKQASEINYFAQ